MVDDDQNEYLDIPLDMNDISDIISDLENFTNIGEALKSQEKLTKQTKALLHLIEQLGISSFLIESYTDYSSSFWIENLLQMVVNNGEIIQEKTLNDAGDLSSDSYGYTYCDKINYRNYEHAKRLFLNE